ncbi:MAG TPA: DegT/DnrJ/EryC1/StrS family aminotransferase, partial [Nocardioidaceae bacterium]|nr:DegT/DnrJ/EryC1/StrS family aminotransferase [Nocardioidaceae bacterium]
MVVNEKQVESWDTTRHVAPGTPQCGMTLERGAARWRVPFHEPHLTDHDIDAVVAVLRTGWITTGAQCVAFETAFADRLGPGVEAVAVSSGTAALHLALEAVGVDHEDLVLTADYTFTASAEVSRYLGAHPVLVDVDARTGVVTPETVLAAYDRLSPADRRRVTALVPVHLGGLPAPMTELANLAAEHGWALVDDAAHALPSYHAGQPIGTLGDATAFSFYVTKTLCTGEGGMVVTRNHEWAQRMRRMRMHGIDREAFDRYRAANRWYYEVVAPGFKYNLPDTAAALGLARLPRLDTERARRAQIAARYTEAFSTVPGLTPPPDAAGNDQHAWHLYTLRVSGGIAVRDAMIEELAGEGIGTSVHFIPLHLQPYYRDTYHLHSEQFPEATALYHQEISLPIFPTMTDEQVAVVCEA